MSIEIAVQNMHTENEQLRARLAVLSANRPKTAASSSANIGFPPLVNPATQAGTDIDYNYLAKLQAELASAKATLLEKELEHVRLKGGKVDADADGLRQLLLSHNTKFTMLRAEANSLDNTLAQLRTQRDELGKQSSVIRRELEARKVSRAMTTSDEQVGENRITEAERLMDVSGWMEAASNDWNQVSEYMIGRQLKAELCHTYSKGVGRTGDGGYHVGRGWISSSRS